MAGGFKESVDLLSAGQETSGVGEPAIRKAASMREIKGLGA